MKRPKRKSRRLSKTVKLSLSISKEMMDYLDDIAEESEVSRSEVVQWILTGLMEDEDLEDQFFGEEEEEEEEESEEED